MYLQSPKLEAYWPKLQLDLTVHFLLTGSKAYPSMQESQVLGEVEH